MNERLRILLKRIPGIIHRARDSGLILEHIDFNDGVKLLSMDRPTARLGGWVRVQKGIYEGDVGFVVSVESWGVQLLLVPRLSSPQVSGGPAVRPLPALFYDESIPFVDSRKYMFRNDRFEHGLIIKPFTFPSISATVSSMLLDYFRSWRRTVDPKGENALQIDF